jgi:hypothetical protein
MSVARLPASSPGTGRASADVCDAQGRLHSQRRLPYGPDGALTCAGGAPAAAGRRPWWQGRPSQPPSPCGAVRWFRAAALRVRDAPRAARRWGYPIGLVRVGTVAHQVLGQLVVVVLNGQQQRRVVVLRAAVGPTALRAHDAARRTADGWLTSARPSSIAATTGMAASPAAYARGVWKLCPAS